MAFFIENGVRRAVAARECGIAELSAILRQEGLPPVSVECRISELHSPKRSIRNSDARFQRILAAMHDSERRSKLPPIEVQELGAPGQPRCIPLADVELED